MKINLPPARREALQAARKKLSVQGRSFREDDAALATLRALAESLPAEIAAMEASIDPTNDDGFLALATKQARLKAVTRSLDAAEATDEARHEELRAALAPAAALIGDILRPVVNEAEAAITEYLAVVFEPSRAAYEARGCAQVQCLAGFAKCQFEQFSDATLAAREAIRVMDMLLSGELPFVTLPGERAPRPKSAPKT